MTVDIGSTRKVSSVQIDWEFPAKAYTLSVSVDGVKWSEVQSTDSNVLHSNHIASGAVPASKVRLIMHQVRRHWGLCRRHCIEFPCPRSGHIVQASGSFHGQAWSGIRKFSVQASRLQSIVEDCAAAAKSNDARDKYFATYVGEFASCSSKTLRSELPSLEVAASLAILQHSLGKAAASLHRLLAHPWLP